ncbi:MAG: hypothetical protein EHM50_10410, partial [Lysobacterales bacterium]
MRSLLALFPFLLAAVLPAFAQAPPPAGFPGTPPPSPPAIIRDLSAEPAAIEPGESTTLRWEVLNAYQLTLEPDVGSVATRGSRRVSPAATTMYTLTATGPGGATTRTLTIAVAGTAPASSAGSTRGTELGAAGIPRLADGNPDLSGVYSADRNVRLVAQLELAPGAESFRVVEAAERDAGTGDDCLPPGVPA